MKVEAYAVFRLLANVLPSGRVEIEEEIEKDIKLFIEMIDQDRPDLKSLEITVASFAHMIEAFVNSILI